MKKVVFTFLLTFSLGATACIGPPLEQVVSPEKLIARTEKIILAKVISAISDEDTNEVKYKFKTIRVLKGNAIDSFEISALPLSERNKNFNNHFDPAFWENYGGRLSYMEDCEIHPIFSVGFPYLIFLDKPYHNKSFEKIIRTHGGLGVKDKWLQYVEDKTGHNKAFKRD